MTTQHASGPADVGDAGPDLMIGLDLARHRALCVATIDGETRPIPLAPGSRGLILRWIDPDGRKHRVTDRILDTAGADDRAAIDVATSVAACVFPEQLPTAPYVAVPPAFGPACRHDVCAGFSAAGIPLTPDHLIDRPIATLAGWIDHRRRLGSPDPVGPLIVIDNDGGQLSACAVDASARRVLFSTPLSTGPEEPIELVAERLRDLVLALERNRSDQPLVRADDWSSVSASISQVVVSGSSSEHSLFAELVGHVLPAAAIVRDPVIADPAEIVGHGLVSLGALAAWSAGWPTLSIAIDGLPVRPAGPVHHAATASDNGAGSADLTLPAGTALSLIGPDGRVAALRIGGVTADAIALPRDLATGATLRTLADGRLLVLGQLGVHPLSIRVDWPLVGPAGEVGVTAVGRRPVQLLNPTADRSHRTTAA